MKAKGFTLIELLAVIVILAIIALIATPIILNIINNSKEESNRRSIDMYATALKNSLVKYQLTNNESIAGNFTTDDGGKLTILGETEPKLIVDYDGNVVCNVIEIYADGTMYLEDCKVNGEEVEYTYGNKASFATDDWKTIVANVKAGYMYEVGQTRDVTLEGFGTYTVRIANTSTPEECNTEGFSQTACGFVIEFEDIITERGMNSTDTNVGGWRDSEMRTYVNDIIYNSLPIELEQSIIDTKVVSSRGSRDTSNFETIDKLYLLSTKEVWGKEGTSNGISTDTSEIETRQLDYYKKIGVTTNNYLGAIKKYKGIASFWWLRSASFSISNCFYIVRTDGNWNFDVARNTYGVSVAFRIG